MPDTYLLYRMNQSSTYGLAVLELLRFALFIALALRYVEGPLAALLLVVIWTASAAATSGMRISKTEYDPRK